MSLVWLYLLYLLLSSAFAASSRASHLRDHLPHHISKGPPDGVAVDRKASYIGDLNSSIQDPHWRKYTMWQVLRADGKTNFCILFFTVYISYLIYVLF